MSSNVRSLTDVLQNNYCFYSVNKINYTDFYFWFAYTYIAVITNSKNTSTKKIFLKIEKKLKHYLELKNTSARKHILSVKFTLANYNGVLETYVKTSLSQHFVSWKWRRNTFQQKWVCVLNFFCFSVHFQVTVNGSFWFYRNLEVLRFPPVKELLISPRDVLVIKLIQNVKFFITPLEDLYFYSY